MPRFSDHVRRRMAERGVTEADINMALRRRHGTEEPGGRPDTIVVRGYAATGRSLTVVHDSADRERVVSVWWG